MFARIALPTLSALKAAGIRTMDTHSRALSATLEAKRRGGFTGRVLTPAIENFAILLTRLALSPAHTGRQFMRRAFYKMPAYSIPVDLMYDMSAAVLDKDGAFRDAEGRPLIRPDLVVDIPIQVIRSKLDTLARWEEQGEYFKELGTKSKQLLDVYEVNHVDSVLATRREVIFFHHILEFLAEPRESAEAMPALVFKPRCENILTQAMLKIRLRGI
jgi:hypothetical protein